MMTGNTTMFDNIRIRWNRRKAIRSQLAHFRYMLEVNKLNEQFITSRIIGDSDQGKKAGWRKELVGAQAQIRGYEDMINFYQSL